MIDVIVGILTIGGALAAAIGGAWKWRKHRRNADLEPSISVLFVEQQGSLRRLWIRAEHPIEVVDCEGDDLDLAIPAEPLPLDSGVDWLLEFVVIGPRPQCRIRYRRRSEPRRTRVFDVAVWRYATVPYGYYQPRPGGS